MPQYNSQLTDIVVMVRPTYFGFNPETYADNLFQNKTGLTESDSCEKALSEFENMVDILESEGVKVVVLESPRGPRGAPTPDAVFPNNWLTTHGNSLIVYPMKAKSRSNERQPEVLIK